MNVGLILAAGAGTRLGGVAKGALRCADGRTYLATIRDLGRAAGVDDWLVVVGQPHARITCALALELGLEVIENPRPERGMASSVALGFEHLLERSAWTCALLWPVDHPGVASATVAQILARRDERGVVIPCHGGRGGHPTVFGRSVWPALAQCTDAPRGARSVIDGLADSRVQRVEVADPGVLVDVDTSADRALVDGERPGSRDSGRSDTHSSGPPSTPSEHPRS